MISLPKPFRASSLPLPLRSVNGRRFVLRRLTADDAEAVAGLHSRLDPESLRLRFGFVPAPMSPEGAERFARVNPRRDIALAVFERLGRELQLVATGHALAAGPEGCAEIFFAVRRDARRIGLASTLLEAVLALAPALGLRELLAQVDGANYPMLSVLIRHGGVLSPIEGTDAMEVRIPLCGS